MKTPMQELIEQFEDRLSSLKEVQATANLETQDFLETQIEELEGCILSAELMLEKEKEVIMDAYDAGFFDGSNIPYTSDDVDDNYFNKSFKTKERCKYY